MRQLSRLACRFGYDVVPPSQPPSLLSTGAEMCSSSGSTNFSAAFSRDTSIPPASLTLPTSSSKLPVIVDASLLCSCLTERQIRQRERRWGALWRYHPEGGALPAVPAVSKPPNSSRDVSTLVSTLPDTAWKATKVDRRDPRQHETASLADASSISGEPIVAAAGSLLAKVADPDTVAAAPPPSSNSHSTAALPVGFVGAATGTGPSAASDPLLAYLEAHGEDGALLLATWTSIHRSCIFASAVTESVALHIRYVLHSLLRRRAVGAAVQLYYRLMGLGVQLGQSDMLLLFSSLAYDDATTSEAEQLRKARESASMEKDRQIWAQRRKYFHKAMVPPQVTEVPPPETVRSGRDECGGVAPSCDRIAQGRQSTDKSTRSLETGTAMTTLSSVDGGAHSLVDVCSAAQDDGTPEGQPIVCSSSGVADEWEVYPPSAIARQVAFHQQPEWIKRWILYEASMGTLDGLENGEGGPSAPTVSPAPGARDGEGESHRETAYWSPTETPEAVAAETAQAMLFMKVNSILHHLHLLALGAMQEAPVSRSLQLPLKVTEPVRHNLTPSRSKSAAKSYWKEALQVVRHAYSPPLLGKQSPPIEDASSRPQKMSTLLLPDRVVTTLQHMIQEARSWEGALALLRLNASNSPLPTVPQPALTMSSSRYLFGAVSFVVMASGTQPWKSQASVEEWMHRDMLPTLANAAGTPEREDSMAKAATAAIHSLWLSHLLIIRATRPDDFITMSEDAEAYLTTLPPSLTLSGALPDLVDEVMALAEQAVDNFRRAVSETMQREYVQMHLAPSIRSGAFRCEEEDEAGGCANVRGTPTASSPEMADAISEKNVCALPEAAAGKSPSAQKSPSTVLSNDMVNVFALCCEAVREAVWIRLATATTPDRPTATAQVLRFLERSLHGSSGLHAIYRDVYTSPSAGQGRRRRSAVDTSPAGPQGASAVVSERAYVSCILAGTFLQLGQLFLNPADTPHPPVGNYPWCGAELVLLVELATGVLRCFDLSGARQLPWRWAVEKQVDALVNTTVGMVRSVVRQLRIHRTNEKVMFGAVAGLDVELLVNLAKLFIQISHLSAAVLSRDTDGKTLKGILWRRLASRSSPRVLTGVHLFLSPRSALGKRVRQGLSRHEAENLRSCLPVPRAQRPLGKRLYGQERLPRLNSTVSVQRPVSAEGISGGTDFALKSQLHDSVYRILLKERTQADIGRALQHLASASPTWKSSLQLCRMITDGVSLARGTCDINFFSTTLDGISRDLVKRKSSSVAVTRTREPLGRMTTHPHAQLNASRRPIVGPSNLWLNAIDVFWAAVDHIPPSMASSAAELATPPATSALVSSPPSPREALERHEQNILEQLLLPLLRFSTAVRRRDLGRQWRLLWASRCAAEERQTSRWRQQNIKALSELGDPSALRLCVTEHRKAPNEELLCAVVLRHADWSAALAAIFDVFGTVERHEASSSVYPNVVVRTMLTLLQRSSMNLSNTALRLRTLQQQQWEVDSSVVLVRILLQARRWRLGLQQVRDALDLPSIRHVKALLLKDPAGCERCTNTASSPEPRTLVQYATLLTLGLQATAIGGDSESSPVFYDSFKELQRYVFSEVVSASSDTDRGMRDEAGLESVLSMAHASMNHLQAFSDAAKTRVHDAVQEEICALAPRARMLFFRAMTKKMRSPSPQSEHHRP